MHEWVSDIMEIRLAKPEEFEKVRKMYWDLIDNASDDPSFPQWVKGLHPSDELLRNSIEKSQLYVAEVQAPSEDSLDMYETVPKIVGAYILCRQDIPAYNTAAWKVDAKPEEALVIEVLAVAHDYRHKGVAKELVRHAAELADDFGIKALRLDVIENNLKAEEMYKNMGFKYIQTVRMDRPVGVRNFRLYELSLI